MQKSKHIGIVTVLFSISLMNLKAERPIIVSQDGKGDFKTIQGAINSLSDSAAEPRVIMIRKGTYHEKIYIEKHNIQLAGEDREATIIIQSIARDQWRCVHNDDWGVATMNVDGNDITLRNITIVNDFGFSNKSEYIIACPLDTINRSKAISKSSHQMALRTMRATRLKAVNCRFRAYGGDTVSPWNVQSGMFYFKDCIMEGGVDFYCPRGRAYAENCEFVAHSGSASIWHDGSADPASKSVIVKSRFRGFDGFKLGRYHRDAQMFLINCVFADNMADQEIYRAQGPAVVQWGHRVYYYNCHRMAGDYAWHKNNLETAPGSPDASSINADWVFDNKWKPQAGE